MFQLINLYPSTLKELIKVVPMSSIQNESQEGKDTLKQNLMQRKESLKKNLSASKESLKSNLSASKESLKHNVKGGREDLMRNFSLLVNKVEAGVNKKVRKIASHIPNALSPENEKVLPEGFLQVRSSTIP